VVDQGRGIPADQLGLVFERFKQVQASDSANRKGSGLGLSICKAIIEQHGGKIGVDSQLGEGSRFWIQLPRAR
jgi:signal transduction histidine kinase